MADENEALWAQQFTTNLRLRLQDKGGKLDDTTLVGNHYGKKAQPCNFLKPVEAQEVIGRNQDIVDTDVPADARWITPKTFDIATKVEQGDELRMIADPMSMYPEVQAKAIRRKWDLVKVNTFFDVALTGEDGTVNVTFPASQQLDHAIGGGGSATGMNVDKLVEALALGHSLEWDAEDASEDPAGGGDEIHSALTHKQNRDLMRQIEIIHGDYTRVSEVRVVNGFLREYKGIKFHHKQNLLTNGSSERRIPLWLKSGMWMGHWPRDIKSRIIENVTKRGIPKRLYTLMTFNATRLDEQKVIEIPCTES